MMEPENDELMMSSDEEEECCVMEEQQLSDDEEVGFAMEQHATLVPSDDEDEQPLPSDEEVACDSEAETAKAVVHKKRRRRRLFGRGGRVRMGAISWWSECKNVEMSGCAFALGYIALSFVLMSLMFNMREIVGDSLVGSKEEQLAQQDMENALERRSPLDEEESDRFEKELAADLFFDKQGQTGGDSEYFENHRVPIILREDEFEQQHDSDEDEFSPGADGP